jgi:hypothetical protein
VIRFPGTAVTPLTSTETRVIWGEARAMTQVQTTAAEPSAPDANLLSIQIDDEAAMKPAMSA